MRLLRELGPSLLIALSLVAFGIGCGGDGGGKAAGVEGGACYPNDTCNNGLDCSLPSKICVRPPTGSAGTGGGAGTTGAGGSASAGTTGAAGTTGVAGNAAGGTGGSASAGTSGSAGTTGAAGTTGSAGTTGTAGASGHGGSGGGGTTGSAGTGGSAGAGGTGGGSARYTLTISLDVVIVMSTGGGAPKPGPVTSVPTGITCGGSFISGSNNGDCEESYTNGTSVVLTAQGNGVVNFTAWTGDCSGTNPVITVVMDRARNCKATFTQIVN